MLLFKWVKAYETGRRRRNDWEKSGGGGDGGGSVGGGWWWVVVGGGGDGGGGLVFKTKGTIQHMSRVPELTKAEVREAQRSWVWSELYKWCQSS